MKRKHIAVMCAMVMAMPLMAEFVQIAPNGRYFVHRDKTIIPLGFNDAVCWPSLAPLAMGDMRGGHRYFQELQQSGVNLLRVMFEYAQDRSNLFLMEDPLGQVNEGLIEIWDRIFELAHTYGIYLIITPWDPFWAYENWDVNPYNTKNGGPIDSFRDFLTDPIAVQNAKDRFQFLIDRYGHHEQILAWELNNEIELWYGRIFSKPDIRTAREIQDWMAEISSFIRKYELKRFGHSRLLTVSTAAPAVHGHLARVLYQLDSIDFLTTHFYFDSVKRWQDPVQIAKDVSMNIAFHQYQIGSDVPFMDSENGPIDKWPLPMGIDQASYRSFSWSHFTSGGSGIGMRWPYTIPHRMPQPLLQVIKAVSLFIDSPGIDWATFGALEWAQAAHITTEKRIFISGSVDRFPHPTQMIGWAIHEQLDPMGTVQISFSGFEPGRYTLEIWDPHTGLRIETRSLDIHERPEEIIYSITREDFAFKLWKEVE